jgi:hypothetical protein
MRGGPFPEADLLPLREATAAAIDSFRLAWEADRTGLLLLVALNTAQTAAEVAQLLASRSAVDGVVDGDRRSVQARRLLVLAGLGLVATAGRSVRAVWGNPVSQASLRMVEGRILDVVAAMELADVEDPAFQDRLQRALSGAQQQSMLFGSALSVPQAVRPRPTSCGCSTPHRSSGRTMTSSPRSPMAPSGLSTARTPGATWWPR